MAEFVITPSTDTELRNKKQISSTIRLSRKDYYHSANKIENESKHSSDRDLRQNYDRELRWKRENEEQKRAEAKDILDWRRSHLQDGKENAKKKKRATRISAPTVKLV